MLGIMDSSNTKLGEKIWGYVIETVVVLVILVLLPMIPLRILYGPAARAAWTGFLSRILGVSLATAQTIDVAFALTLLAAYVVYKAIQASRRKRIYGKLGRPFRKKKRA